LTTQAAGDGQPFANPGSNLTRMLLVEDHAINRDMIVRRIEGATA
jgi:hypothetical protein